MTRRLSALLAVLLLAVPSFAQSVTLPETVAGLPGQWIVVPFKAVDGGTPKVRLAPGLSEVNLAALFPDFDQSKVRGRVVQALKPGRYSFEAWNAKADKASDIATCIIIVGDAPPVTQPPADPGQPQPPIGTGKYLFLIVRANDSPKQEYINYLGNPGWDQLRSAGHRVYDQTVNEAVAYGVRFGTAPNQPNIDVPFGTPLPTILTLAEASGKAKIVRGPLTLPDPANIIHLPEGIQK